jgi:hypothetical protein
MNDSATNCPLTTREVRKSLRNGTPLAIRTTADELAYQAAIEAENAASVATRGGLGRLPVFTLRRDLPSVPTSSARRDTRKGLVAGRVRVWWDEHPYRGQRDFTTDHEAEAFIARFKAEGRGAAQ